MEEIKQLYIDLCDASIKKDIEKLKYILADNYVLVHMTGKRQSKEEYIKIVKTLEI